MAKHLNKGLPFSEWPSEDQLIFTNLTACVDILEDSPWSSLSLTSVRNRKYALGQFLGFLRADEPELLRQPLSSRVTPSIVKRFVEAMRRNCTETSIGINLQRLHLTLVVASPTHEWTWLYQIQRRIALNAKTLPKQMVSSVDLYRIGCELMEDAKSKSIIFDRVVQSQAELFRDGLMIATLAESPMRRAGFAALCLGKHVIKIGGRWRIYLEPEMVKTRMEQDFDLSHELGEYVDEYVDTFRTAFPDADKHNGMWPYGDRPMTDKMVRRYIRKHTERRLGYAVSPHEFRRAAATFITQADPANARMAKDLLGHKSFAMTEKYYIAAGNSRIAGRALANAVAGLRDRHGSDLEQSISDTIEF